MKTHIETITTALHTYTIGVEGTMDGTNTRDPIGYGNYQQAWETNLSVRLENMGDEVLKNPWITVNGKRHWRSIEDILAEILDDGMSEAEKARAIWEFARKHRYHFTTGDDEVKDTVKMLNVYGYTLCWDEAYTVSNLWQAAGLKIRRGIPHGHCTTEVFFDGKYHLLDSDEHLMILLRDNETIAGEDDLARDHDLMKRAHAYGILQKESRQTSESAAALFIHAGPRSGDRPFIGGHRMDVELRPGEALLWEWEDRDKYHSRKPPRLCNGRLHYTPRLDDTFARWSSEADNWRSADGVLHSATADTESTLTYLIHSPYVIVGGQLEVDFSSGQCTAEISCDGITWNTVGAISSAQSLALDAHFAPETPPAYTYHLRLRGRNLAVQKIFVETDLQMAPLSLPALEVGDNHIAYRDESETTTQVEITHTWRQRDDSKPPQPPQARFPQPDAQVDGTQLTFAWEPVTDAADYHFQLGTCADLKYCLSPTFDKLVSNTPSAGKAEWSVPYEGLLNPDQTYYWRVRARNNDGLWGPWSSSWAFSAKAPGVPLDVDLEVDWEQRALVLHWHPNPRGTPAVRYEIHGSDERGFSASREPYTAFAGDSGETNFAANFIAATEATSHIFSAGENRCFYRVVAVDENGQRSAPSDFAAAPRPFIYSRPPEQINANQVSTYQVETLRCIGDLRAVSKGPQRYFSAFRDADQLDFILDEGPDFLELDAASGLLTAQPSSQHASTHTVTIRVHNGQGSVDVQGFDLEVLPHE